MMNALLVDDNFQMLEYMNDCIPWLEKGITVELCESGEEALKYATKKKPDILITDIDMPEMNGLELIDLLHAINPNLESLIISCHDNFNYAKHAVKLNVTDYILKDMLEPENLAESIDLLVSKIKEKENSNGQIDKLKSYIDQNQWSLKRHLLHQIRDHSLSNSDNLKSQLNNFGLKLDEFSYIPVVVQITNKDDVMNKYKSSELYMFAIDNISAEVAVNKGEEMISFMNDEYELICFVKVKSLIKNNPFVEMKKLLSHVEEVIDKHLNIEISMVHYHQPISNLTQMKESLSKLMNIGCHWFYVGGNEIISFHDIDYSFSQVSIFSEYTTFYEEINDMVTDQSEDKVKEVIKKWINLFGEKRYHPDEVKSLIHSILINLAIRHQYLYQSDSNQATVLHSQVNAISTINQVNFHMYKYIKDMMDYLRSEMETTHEDILKAKRYVVENMHKKIRMEEASTFLYMNSSYFSRLFRKETGMTFTEYVTKTKIEKSTIYLIETELTVEEISHKLGYENTSYYIKLFKKYFSIPPMEYRKNYKFSKVDII
ncbi:hypothetical protein CR203_13900 [Salipaludibacillus neizhouensis]|uniref:DNA-binding response regulator n=1 Tax=Salipaludibacillus neizhouensis TaxID=885475 RepID=A0A3A9K680_9BACI|nr:response regulator [Salipaludibacillus neizhouensis]RKL66918.1 hypothetical protein CR203_13900 [Salipaludibacillus neizhouensis]